MNEYNFLIIPLGIADDSGVLNNLPGNIMGVVCKDEKSGLAEIAKDVLLAMSLRNNPERLSFRYSVNKFCYQTENTSRVWCSHGGPKEQLTYYQLEELLKRQSIRDKAQKDMKDQEDAVRSKIDKVDLNFDEEKLSVWHKNNQDGYGARIIEFSIHWSKLISLYKKDFSVNEAVKMACSDADFDGITGFMHSASKNILLDCLKEDEETLNAIRNS